MEQYAIKGGNPLVGEVEIGGAKNAALAILSAAIMTDETVTIDNLPNVRDINVLLDAIREIGAQVDRIDAHTVKINGSFIRDYNVDNEFIRKIRASYYSNYTHTKWGGEHYDLVIESDAEDTDAIAKKIIEFINNIK